MGFNVFVSHSVSREDHPLLAELGERARSIGIDLYLAERDAQPGTQLSTKVRNSILRADLVFALLTQEGAASAWVNQEIGVAHELRKRIVPMVEEGVKAPGMIAEMEQIRFNRGRSSEAFDRVARFLERAKTDKEFWETIAIVGGTFALILFAIWLLSRGD